MQHKANSLSAWLLAAYM